MPQALNYDIIIRVLGGNPPKTPLERRHTMLKRNKSFLIRLSQDELTQLNNDVEKTGLSRESYVRSLINGYIPAARPSNDFQKVLYFLRITSNNLNQIAMIANKNGNINAEEYALEVQNLKMLILEIKQEQSKAIKINYGCHQDMGH